MLSETIATERLTLRPPRLDDAPAVFERYARDLEVVRYLIWKPHETVSTVRYFLQYTIRDREDGTHVAWAIIKNADGRLMGMIDARLDGFKATVGYCLARDEWGNGFMTETLRAVIDAVFSAPEIFRVSAVCDVENAASARVMEKAGMTREGILRRYVVHPNVSPEPRDACCYAKVRSS